MSTKAMAKLDVHTIGKANPHLFFVEAPQPLPRYGGKRSRWDVVAVTRTEADIMARLKEHSTPHRETTKFYDKHGGEDVGDGW